MVRQLSCRVDRQCINARHSGAIPLVFASSRRRRTDDKDINKNSKQPLNTMHPVEIDVLNGGTELRVIWQDDTVSTISGEKLRNACGCVECKSKSLSTHSGHIPLSTEASRTIREVHLMSSSTLLVYWNDGHDKSYYSFKIIREEFPPARQNTSE